MKRLSRAMRTMADLAGETKEPTRLKVNRIGSRESTKLWPWAVLLTGPAAAVLFELVQLVVKRLQTDAEFGGRGLLVAAVLGVNLKDVLHLHVFERLGGVGRHRRRDG